MGLGLDLESKIGSNEDIVPYCKYDARAGRLFRMDREQDSSGSYNNTKVDITNTFKAVVDLENVEVGWMQFGADAAPKLILQPLAIGLPGVRPPDHKQGVRFMMKLSAQCGGDVREISNSSMAFLRGVDELHNAYEAGKATNAGKLPVVSLKTTVGVESGTGKNKSTNYQPVFEIVGWAPRPADLIFKPKGRTSPTANGNTPPATGSTQVAPPVAKQAVKQMAMAGGDDEKGPFDSEDFG